MIRQAVISTKATQRFGRIGERLITGSWRVLIAMIAAPRRSRQETPRRRDGGG